MEEIKRWKCFWKTVGAPLPKNRGVLVEELWDVAGLPISLAQEEL